MIEKRYGTLEGLEAPILVYETVKEADDAAGRPDACLLEANNNLVYRGPLQDAREIVCELLLEETNIERLKRDTGKRDKENKPILVDEAEGAYAKRVAAAKGWEDLKHLQGKFDELCRNRVETDDEGNPKRDESGKPITFALAADITQRVRTSKPKTIAAKYIETAKKVLAGGKVEKFLEAVRQEVGRVVTLTGDAESDLKVVAQAAKDICEVRERAALANMPGM